MARFNKGMFGGFTGRLRNVVGYTLNGKPVAPYHWYDQQTSQHGATGGSPTNGCGNEGTDQYAGLH